MGWEKGGGGFFWGATNFGGRTCEGPSFPAMLVYRISHEFHHHQEEKNTNHVIGKILFFACSGRRGLRPSIYLSACSAHFPLVMDLIEQQ